MFWSALSLSLFLKRCLVFYVFIVQERSLPNRTVEDTTLHCESSACLSLRGHQAKVLVGAVSASNGTYRELCLWSWKAWFKCKNQNNGCLAQFPLGKGPKLPPKGGISLALQNGRAKELCHISSSHPEDGKSRVQGHPKLVQVIQLKKMKQTPTVFVLSQPHLYLKAF